MKPLTGQVNPAPKDIDRGSSLEILAIISQQYKCAAEAVSQLSHMAEAVDLIVERLETRCRLVHSGMGTCPVERRPTL